MALSSSHWLWATPSTEEDDLNEVQPTKHAVLSVFFEGTSNSVRVPWTTQVGLFAMLCKATELTDDVDISTLASGSQLKLLFDGCGVTNGFMGTVFASGLRPQCELVESYIKKLLKANFKLTINCLGLSRGGMAILILIQKLAKFNPNRIVMNTLLFDPVPGNLITSYSLDILSHTLASQCMDVSSSKNLAKVLAIYPHIPLPDFTFHAPIIPEYPQSAQVEELVILGCHQGALYSPNINVACALSYHLICDFLSECGTLLELEKSYFQVEKSSLLIELDQEVQINNPTIRYTHSQKGYTIIRKSQAKDIRFLNAYHRKLYEELHGKTNETSEYLLQISRKN